MPTHDKINSIYQIPLQNLVRVSVKCSSKLTMNIFALWPLRSDCSWPRVFWVKAIVWDWRRRHFRQLLFYTKGWHSWVSSKNSEFLFHQMGKFDFFSVTNSMEIFDTVLRLLKTFTKIGCIQLTICRITTRSFHSAKLVWGCLWGQHWMTATKLWTTYEHRERGGQYSVKYDGSEDDLTSVR